MVASHPVEGFDRRGEAGETAVKIARAVRVVPEVRIGRLRLKSGQFGALRFDVKETSRAASAALPVVGLFRIA